MEELSGKERKRILEEFSENLKKPLSEIYYDESELAFIFDLANEDEDYYLMNEALMIGARLYPDSETFTQRRALYYVHEEDDGETLRRHLDHNRQSEGVITDLLTLSISQPTKAETERRLDNILANTETLDEEETVRFCEVANQLGCLDYLDRNLPLLESKVSYHQTLLFEIANWMLEAGNYERAKEISEKLIENDPYSFGSWILLGTASKESFDWMRALEAADMALAIEPDREEAITLKLSILEIKPVLGKEDANFAEEIAEKFPFDSTLIPKVIKILMAYGRNSRAIAIGMKFFKMHPENRGAAFFLLTVSSPYSKDRVAANFIKANLHNPDLRDLILGWIEELSKEKSAVTVMLWKAYIRFADPEETRWPQNVIYAMYCCRKFEEVLEITKFGPSRIMEETLRPLIIFVQFHSLLVKKEYESAVTLASFLEELSPDLAISGNERMEYYAVHRIIKDAIGNGDLKRIARTNWKNFDPLGIWEDYYKL